MPLAITALLAKVNWRIVWIGLGALLSAFLVWSYLDTRQANIDLSERLRASERTIEVMKAEARADDKAIATRNELLEGLAAMEVTERAETIKALEANPDWAKQPIPADVLASLRK